MSYWRASASRVSRSAQARQPSPSSQWTGARGRPSAARSSGSARSKPARFASSRICVSVTPDASKDDRPASLSSGSAHASASFSTGRDRRGAGSASCGGFGGNRSAPRRLRSFCMTGTTCSKSSPRGLLGSESSTQPLKTFDLRFRRESRNRGSRTQSCLLRPSTLTREPQTLLTRRSL